MTHLKTLDIMFLCFMVSLPQVAAGVLWAILTFLHRV